MIAGVHAGFPGFQMARTSGIDRFGDQLRFAWELNAADGTPIVAGLDVAELAPDGRLQRVTGFWGDLPEACPGVARSDASAVSPGDRRAGSLAGRLTTARGEASRHGR